MAMNQNILVSNMSVKGTRRTQALLKVSGLIWFVGFAKVLQPARPLLLR
jgi:hypothetical protein